MIEDTRRINYIDQNEDTLEKEVEWALNHTAEERFNVFLQHQFVIHAMAGINYLNHIPKKIIYYIDEEGRAEK